MNLKPFYSTSWKQKLYRRCGDTTEEVVNMWNAQKTTPQPHPTPHQKDTHITKPQTNKQTKNQQKVKKKPHCFKI